MPTSINCSLLEERAHFRLPDGNLLEGKITGIDENGKLLIEHNSEENMPLESKRLSLFFR